MIFPYCHSWLQPIPPLLTSSEPSCITKANICSEVLPSHQHWKLLACRKGDLVFFPGSFSSQKPFEWDNKIQINIFPLSLSLTHTHSIAHAPPTKPQLPRTPPPPNPQMTNFHIKAGVPTSKPGLNWKIVNLRLLSFRCSKAKIWWKQNTVFWSPEVRG